MCQGRPASPASASLGDQFGPDARHGFHLLGQIHEPPTDRGVNLHEDIHIAVFSLVAVEPALPIASQSRAPKLFYPKLL